MKEGSGAVIGFGFLLLWFAAIIGALTNSLDDFLVWAIGGQLLSTIGSWLAIIALVAVVILSSKFFSNSNRFAHGHVTHVQGGDKAREALQKHENAHQKVCARVGGGGSTIHIWPENGGWSGKTVFHDPHRIAALEPEKKIAISLAGLIAAPDTISNTDKPHAKAYARESDNPSAAMRKGKQIAKKIV